MPSSEFLSQLVRSDAGRRPGLDIAMKAPEHGESKSICSSAAGSCGRPRPLLLAPPCPPSRPVCGASPTNSSLELLTSSSREVAAATGVTRPLGTRQTVSGDAATAAPRDALATRRSTPPAGGAPMGAPPGDATGCGSTTAFLGAFAPKGAFWRERRWSMVSGARALPPRLALTVGSHPSETTRRGSRHAPPSMHGATGAEASTSESERERSCSGRRRTVSGAVRVAVSVAARAQQSG